jgi:hypothetical protein
MFNTMAEGNLLTTDLRVVLVAQTENDSAPVIGLISDGER